MRRWIARVGLCVLAASSLAVSACADESVRPLTSKSRVMPFALGDEAKQTTGKLKHLGSLRLTSEDTDFGGLSGLIVSADGSRFLAITDSSHWLTGELSYRDGRLIGATTGEIGPLLTPDGAVLSGKSGDAEGLTGSLDGDVYVSFEGNHRIWRYPFGKDGLKAVPTAVAVPDGLTRAPSNGGLEGLALLRDGRLLALTESFHNSDGNIRGWLLKDKTFEALTLKRRAPFDLTDVQQMPGGDVLTLERRFSRAGGVGFSMRRIAAKDIVPDAVTDGEVLAEVGMSHMIDNMEGLSVRTDAEGRTILYLVSDDNFNAPLQQTLLMMFALDE